MSSCYDRRCILPGPDRGFLLAVNAVLLEETRKRGTSYNDCEGAGINRELFYNLKFHGETNARSYSLLVLRRWSTLLGIPLSEIFARAEKAISA